MTGQATGTTPYMNLMGIYLSKSCGGQSATALANASAGTMLLQDDFQVRQHLSHRDTYCSCV